MSPCAVRTTPRPPPRYPWGHLSTCGPGRITPWSHSGLGAGARVSTCSISPGQLSYTFGDGEAKKARRSSTQVQVHHIMTESISRSAYRSMSQMCLAADSIATGIEIDRAVTRSISDRARAGITDRSPHTTQCWQAHTARPIMTRDHPNPPPPLITTLPSTITTHRQTANLASSHHLVN